MALTLGSNTRNLFSLVLDLCNDLGVAVPITCERNGIVFRAYRHGEDVKFADGELALAHDVLSGLLKSTRQADIPRLTLEKTLALLIKVGTAMRFLEPFYGSSGVDGIARISFDLKGAVAKLTKGPRERTDRDLWLSSYLVNRGVINVSPTTKKYTLGTRVEGNYVRDGAPDQAYELGCILGMLLQSSKDASRRNAPLNNEALIILATCWPPRHVAAAIQVELDIFRRWYEEEGSAVVRGADLTTLR